MEKAVSRALEITLTLKNVFTSNPGILDEIEKIALTYSPSSAFSRAYAVASLYKLSPSEALGIAKLARWIAVLKRDAGEQEARKLVARIRSLIGASPGTVAQQLPPLPQHLETLAESPRIIPGIYRYGSYDWIAEARLEKIATIMKARHGVELPKELGQVAIEVFHSLYLLDTALAENRIKADKRLAALAEFTKPLRENRGLRSQTVLDEFASLSATADIMAKIVEKYNEMKREAESKRQQFTPCRLVSSREAREALAGAAREAGNNIDKEAMKVIESFGRKAGVGHKIGFEEKVKLYEILRKYRVLTSSILEAIKSIKNEMGMQGETYDFAGYRSMRDYSELPQVPAADYGYPEAVVLTRLLTKTMRVREHREGVRSRKRRFIVLIDKSGSMSGEKIEKAKAVAISLLLRDNVDDVKIAFFDYEPWPEKPIELRRDPVAAIEKVAAVTADGGTSIDSALAYADRHAPGYDIVLITDGEDKVTYKPRNRLISIMVGDNEELEKISEKYISVDDILQAVKQI